MIDAIEMCRGGGGVLLSHIASYTDMMVIVMDVGGHIERSTGAPLPPHLIEKVARKSPGMGNSTIVSDSNIESLFSFITSTKNSRAQQAAAPPLQMHVTNGWLK